MQIPPHVTQIALPGLCPVEAAVEKLASSGIEERGAVYTKREVVDFILDLVGYTVDKPLHQMRLLEPSFGGGDFLIPVLERLLEAYKRHGAPHGDPVEALSSCVKAVELHRETFLVTRMRLIQFLVEAGLSPQEGESLLSVWLSQGDFLLTNLHSTFTHVVGNPPYIRQELIPDELWIAYRSRFDTIFDRADIYIPFIEKSLLHLTSGGVLGLICADRWMKNRYGGPLRKLVAARFRLKFYVDMVNTSAFHTDVIAYPAITVIANEPDGPTRITYRPEIMKNSLDKLAEQMLSPNLPSHGVVREVVGVAIGSEPWLMESLGQLALLRRLEATFPTVEEAGCTVGIGVATGADKAFIAPFDAMAVEPDRKLPLIMTGDIETGEVAWRGFGVINPFKSDGGLVDLKDYPKLARYLEDRREAIAGRYIARKNPAVWYRTIDRIHARLTNSPKLLIPDIKGEAHIVFDEGKFYPHHNLYYITSDDWDLKALQAVLQSGIALLFVSMYSTKMRGGFLRFQAQYLRRIRIPRWTEISEEIREDLRLAIEKGNQAELNATVYKLYGLSVSEVEAIIGSRG